MISPAMIIFLLLFNYGHLLLLKQETNETILIWNDDYAQTKMWRISSLMHRRRNIIFQ